jgi:homoserine dehydrogenase
MNVAILGFGTVGKGVYDIIKQDFSNIKIKAILVKNPKKHPEVTHLLVDNIIDIIEDNVIDIVIELIGGKVEAYNYVKLALENGKHVITANKALVSHYFEELIYLAKQNNVQFRFEASVGAAINIIDPLNTIRKFNHINKIEGIINGSTNYILSKVFIENKTFSEALVEAKDLGYIESDASDDLDGYDLLRKINILSMIAYSQVIKEDDILRVSLTSVSDKMIDYLKKNSLGLKYLATSILINKEIMICLEPVTISQTNLYNNINYEENIITIFGEYHKKQSFIGQGAGRYPTASAVIYDLLMIKNKKYQEFDLNYSYQINHKLIKHDYIVEKADKITKLKAVFLEDILKDDLITCFVRIGEDDV